MLPFERLLIEARLSEVNRRIATEATKKVSPIAWQHINLQGRYEFQKQPDPLNMDAIIRELTEMFTHDRNAFAEISSGQPPMGGKHITLSGDLRTMSGCT